MKGLCLRLCAGLFHKAPAEFPFTAYRAAMALPDEAPST